MMISIGSKINWEHPLTSEMFEGTVVRIEDWFEPEKISTSITSNSKEAFTERFLIFWGESAPFDNKRSWIYGTDGVSLL
jgi:hypothetical protein|tara:strand:+ start:182 stop:418 length:237 start_codon:yes stop_codon:yes gene_type:complete